MSEQVTKQVAVETLAEGHRLLFEAIDPLSGDLIDKHGLGGGEWSIKDLIGHLESWERAALDTIEDRRAKRSPRIRQLVHDAESMNSFNASEVDRKRTRRWEEQRAAYQVTHDLLIETIAEMDDSEWSNPDDEGWTLGMQVGSNTGAPERPFGHVFAHIEDVRNVVHLARGGSG
ncbi:MAG TPA: maleylpyruvate isomerase N-terminal domain-containing protein [Actinomycetota bacterium]|nr:maleylpyruvate isomerase N-terminal domain-containing protein [Actinomycetota bacterium]